MLWWCTFLGLSESIHTKLGSLLDMAEEGEEYKDAFQAFGLENSVAVRTIH